jgi:two-component system, OmpR family, phosphate regulon response regulator OmpR
MGAILVVDDDRDVVEACRLFLEGAGHEVSAAHSRGGGMRAVEKRPFDLILLDVMMERPDDGITMARDLRKGGFRAPIMLLTSVGRATGMTFRPNGEMLPVEKLLEKPVAPAELVETVAELLERGRKDG